MIKKKKNRHSKNLDPRLDLTEFQAKIDEEYQQQKMLEKPEVIGEIHVRVTSSPSLVLHRKNEVLETVPPAPASKLPLTVGGEDKDPIARERRDKVKEVSLFFPSYSYKIYCRQCWLKEKKYFFFLKFLIFEKGTIVINHRNIYFLWSWKKDFYHLVIIDHDGKEELKCFFF